MCSGCVMVVTTDGIVKSWLSVPGVVMVDRGGWPGWVLGGEIVLVVADGGLEVCWLEGGAARYDWSVLVFCSMSFWRVSCAVTKLVTVWDSRLKSAAMVISWEECRFTVLDRALWVVRRRPWRCTLESVDGGW